MRLVSHFWWYFPSTGPSSQPSWVRLAWDRKTPTSEMRPGPRGISSPWSTPSSTESWPTGTTWRGSGNTPSTLQWSACRPRARGAPTSPDWGPPQPNKEKMNIDNRDRLVGRPTILDPAPGSLITIVSLVLDQVMCQLDIFASIEHW